MVIRLGEWAMENAQTGDIGRGNWVQAVGASTKPVQVTEAKPAKPSAAKPAATGGGTSFASDFDDDIPF
jgi:hypothetical protein